MMKIGLGKLLTLLLFIITLSTYVISPVIADGSIYDFDSDLRVWELALEEGQLAAINYEDGVQNMILAVNTTKFKGSKAVWLFPIPASPEETSIDIISGFPKYSGENINDSIGKVILSNVILSAISQIYPIPLSFCNMFLMGSSAVPEEVGFDEVQVYEHVEKMGMTTELISTKDGEALDSYLSREGLDFPDESKSMIEQYVGEDYIFVISWISDIYEFNRQGNNQFQSDQSSNTLGVQVTFTTDKMYFPLKLTSLYGDRIIPITLYVVGHVELEVYQDIKDDVITNFYIQTYDYKPSQELLSFYNQEKEIATLKYTRIEINTESNNFTDDLWIEDTAPVKANLLSFIHKTSMIWGVLIFILSSCLASLSSGYILFKNASISKKKLTLWGLWNFLTIVGFFLVTMFSKFRNERKQESASSIVDGRRKLKFIALFSLLFIAYTAIFDLVLYFLSSILK